MKSVFAALAWAFSLFLFSGRATSSEPPVSPELARPSESPRPNVLLIAIDDLNDWVGPLGGHPQAKTPHIDRLAARGTVFLNAHCQAPLCTPSRTSVLTGLRPSTSGVYALEPWFRTAERWRDLVALPQYFARHGYRTLTTGKVYHDAHPPPEGRAGGTEFSVWGYHGGFRPLPAKKFVETPEGNHPLVDWGIFPEDDREQDDWKVAEWAIERLEKPEEPFLLCVGFRHPHVPCYASKKWFDLYPEDSLELPPVLEGDRDDTPRFSWYLHWRLPEPRLAWLRANGQWRPLVRAYLASVSFVDAMVGRVLETLERKGLSERTIVVLWSDQGWHLGEKGITGKTTLWERSTRVPLIFAGPGIARGERCTRPAELLDIYPTLIELCGVPPKPDLEGTSLMPQLRDPRAPRDRPAITTHGPGNHAVRSERYRYIRYADGSEELYDLARDPNEWTNLLARPTPEIEAVRKDLARWLPERSAEPLPGSRSRLIELKGGVAYWEGSPIDPEERPR